MTMLVGISGPIASGKSTLGCGLQRIFGLMHYRAEVIPFATGLKYLASLYDNPQRFTLAYQYFLGLGYNDGQAYHGTTMLLEAFDAYPIIEGIKPRQLYQYIGTELGREAIDQDIWIKAVHQQIKNMGNKPHFVVSDDMRFVNESNRVDYHIAITIDTPSAKAMYEARKSLFPKEYFFSDHKSEKERHLLRAPDFTIETDFSVDAVVDLVEGLIAAKTAREYNTSKLSYKNAIELDGYNLQEYMYPPEQFIDDWYYYPHGRYPRLITSGSIPDFVLKKKLTGDK